MTVRASNFARVENDLYETEPWAVEALLRALPDINQAGSLQDYIWEPAAGNHAISFVLERYGFIVITSDIAQYRQQHSAGLIDFFAPNAMGRLNEQEIYRDKPARKINSIITNPPYGKANRDAVRFAELALERCPGWVALLLTAKFDFGKTRQHLFKNNSRFMGKVALLDRLSLVGNGKTGTDDHAWYIWGPAGKKHQAQFFYMGKKDVQKEEELFNGKETRHA